MRRLVSIASGVGVLTTSMLGNRAVAADAKMAQTVVGYQDSPQGAEDCGNCVQFEPPASCKVVAGNISPGAWCKIYAKKSG
jgi:hypothetical protein